MSNNSTPSFEEIRKIQAENSQQIKELRDSQKETGQQMSRLFAENSQQIKELRDSQKEANQQIRQSFAEANKERAKTERMVQKIGGRFNARWGHLVESLVEGKLTRLLREKGIPVLHTHPNVKREVTNKEGGIVDRKEFDIIAVNGKEVVLVEVKTVLTRKDVSHFLENHLKDFKEYFPEYQDKVLYGAVAFLRTEDSADTFSEEQGLFVIKATGDSAHIINKSDFKPKAFS